MQSLLRAFGGTAVVLAFLVSGGASYRTSAQPADSPRPQREIPVRSGEAPAQGGMCMAAPRPLSPPGSGPAAPPGSVSIPIRKIGDIERMRETVRTLNTQGYNYRELDPGSPIPGASDERPPAASAP